VSDIALDLDGGSPNYLDLKIVDGDLVLTESTEAIRQHILQRLRSFLGEWFMDNTIGLPYFQQILVKNPDQSKIDALFINQILGTPGVIQLNTYAFKPDFVNRKLEIAFSAQTTTGTVDYAGALT
jgi:hypothetical protein